MNTAMRKKLEAAGFRVGDAEDFLALTPEERELVTPRVALRRLARVKRGQSSSAVYWRRDRARKLTGTGEKSSE